MHTGMHPMQCMSMVGKDNMHVHVCHAMCAPTRMHVKCARFACVCAPHFFALMRSFFRLVTVCVALGVVPLDARCVCHIQPNSGTSTSSSNEACSGGSRPLHARRCTDCHASLGDPGAAPYGANGREADKP
eukprot:363419-Chlamydomonas_euryale.AAC.11